MSSDYPCFIDKKTEVTKQLREPRASLASKSFLNKTLQLSGYGHMAYKF